MKDEGLAAVEDRDSKWTDRFRRLMEGAGIRIVQTPIQAPNANAYAERFVRSIREECLDRVILFGMTVTIAPAGSAISAVIAVEAC